MVNKTFILHHNAAAYFNLISKQYTTYWILNTETDMYEILCQDDFELYQDIGVEYKLIDVAL
jgi:hypothetical protein